MMLPAGTVAWFAVVTVASVSVAVVIAVVAAAFVSPRTLDAGHAHIHRVQTAGTCSRSGGGGDGPCLRKFDVYSHSSHVANRRSSVSMAARVRGTRRCSCSRCPGIQLMTAQPRCERLAPRERRCAARRRCPRFLSELVSIGHTVQGNSDARAGAALLV
jgi:hypothetical protein